MKDRKISTLSLHHLLGKAGIEIPPRTLQKYIDEDFEKTKDKRLKVAALKMIKSYDNIVNKISKL